MRLSAALVALLTPTVSSFSVWRSSAAGTTSLVGTTTSRTIPPSPFNTALENAFELVEPDEYDNWYDDFDPSEFGEPDDGNFMGAGSGHDYSRDSDADNSQVDLDTVNSLIAERLKARKTGQFDIADSIRDQLLDQHGVLVKDMERVWRSGCSRNGSGQKWLGGRQRGPKAKRGKQDFGPNGHDYDLVTEAGPNVSDLSDPEIHDLIAERLQCKLARDFQTADRIQEQLFSSGVAVHDGMKLWRADGEGFGDMENSGRSGKPGREAGSRNDRNRPYEQSPNSLETDDAAEIQSMVEERTEAKKIRNFGLADAIRDELRDVFNVEVDDRKRMWSVGGDFGANNRDRRRAPFQKAPWSETPDDADEIQRLVEMRDAARADRDFATADDIRDDLVDRNIYIDDKAREWSVAGGGVRQNRSQPRQAFAMSPQSDAPENADEIQRLVELRDTARADRDYVTADSIRDELMDDYNVFIDDRSREWAVGDILSKDAKSNKPNGIFTRTGGGALSKEDEESIIELLRERDAAKCDKDYDTADSIRRQLNEDFLVQVDDKNREWHVVTNEYVQSVDSSIVLEASVESYISEQVANRAAAKLNKEYDVADEIRDELENEYNVQIDDRLKVWSVRSRPTTSQDSEYDEIENFSDAEASEPEVTTLSEEDLNALTVPELKEKLKAAGKPVSGRKAELIERLLSV